MNKIKSFMYENKNTGEQGFIVLQEQVIIRNKGDMKGRNAKIRILKGPQSLYKKPELIYSEQQKDVKVLVEVIYNVGNAKQKNTADHKIFNDVSALYEMIRRGEMSISVYEYKF